MSVNQKPQPKLRLDAQRNVEKLKEAALAAFEEQGLDAPLEAVARRAGVSTGTLYNRFGSREGLIDAVLPDLAASKLALIVKRTQNVSGDWERFVCYVEGICEMQMSDSALNDAMSQRFPQAQQLMAVCKESLLYGQQLIIQAQDQGSLRPDFNLEDLFFLFWANGALVRFIDEAPSNRWRQFLGFILDGLRT